MTEILESPIPRISNMIKARLALDDRKITSLKDSMENREDGN